MSKAIERVKAHYKALAEEPLEIRVPEWDQDGDEFTVYSTPMTMHERQKILMGNPSDQEVSVNVVILKAKDKDGNPVFTKEDKQTLMRSASSSVIKRISQAIINYSNQGAQDDVEELVKN